MTAPVNKRGLCSKNGLFRKNGLTKREQVLVAASLKDNELRWKVLFSQNVWRPCK